MMVNYKLADNISWRDIQGQILILDPRINQKAHELNPLASSIWLMISQNKNHDEIVKEITDHYQDQKTTAEIHDDITTFLTELLELKLISHAA